MPKVGKVLLMPRYLRKVLGICSVPVSAHLLVVAKVAERPIDGGLFLLDLQSSRLVGRPGGFVR